MSRQQLARLAAPAAFLLGITVAVLLVRAGLEGGSAPARTTALGPVTHAPARTIQTIATTAAVPHRTSTAATIGTTATTAAASTAAATTATTTTTGGTTSVAGATYYTVVKGDTFNKIAAKTGTSVAELETLNPGVSSSALQVGQQLRIK